MDGVRAIESAANPADLATKLHAIFKPLAPTVQLYVTGQPPATDLLLFASAPQRRTGRLLASHRFRSKEQSALSQRSRSQGCAARQRPHRRSLSAASLSKSTSAAASPRAFRSPYSPMRRNVAQDRYATSVDTPRYSAATIAPHVWLTSCCYGTFSQHFYPYFDVVKTNWARRSVPKALPAPRPIPMKGVPAHAPHHDVGASGRTRAGFPARGAEDLVAASSLQLGRKRARVTRVADESLDIRPGDLVVRIDGKTRNNSFRSAGVGAGRHAAIQALGRVAASAKRRQDSEVTLELKTGGGEARTVVVRRTKQMDAVDEIRPPKIGEAGAGNLLRRSLTRHGRRLRPRASAAHCRARRDFRPARLSAPRAPAFSLT